MNKHLRQVSPITKTNMYSIYGAVMGDKLLKNYTLDKPSIYFDRNRTNTSQIVQMIKS